MAPVARRLSARFRVIEPFQRGGGAEPLSVAHHVADLQRLVEHRCSDAPVAVVGSSWGAMLALAWAAVFPDRQAPLVLVGCGTFDKKARRRMHALIEERKDDALRRRLAVLEQEVADPDERLRQRGELLLPVYAADPLTTDLESQPCDHQAHIETWRDMVRLQELGVYPAAFAAISAPVLMLHGADDPHPGAMIRDSLRPYLPQLEYREWQHCGHYPWLEKAVSEEFFTVLGEWLTQHLSEEEVE